MARLAQRRPRVCYGNIVRQTGVNRKVLVQTVLEAYTFTKFTQGETGKAGLMKPLWTVVCILLVFCAATSIASFAQQCNAVAYLFRHAEDLNGIKKTWPFQVTLATSGQAHAQLYIEMMNKFQQQNFSCPVKVVYALNPRNFDGSNGTSNPYWTAEPLAQMAQATLDSTLENANAIITVQVMDDTLKLTEYLNHGEGQQFVDDIKGRLNNQQSVAIFWTSQGMCAVAERLGVDLPTPYTCDEVDPKKPPRNSVFQFDYSVSGGKFTNVTEYAQCFNFNADPTVNSFTNGTYYCQYSFNLQDWEGIAGFSNKLQKISGRICDKNNPQLPCVK